MLGQHSRFVRRSTHARATNGNRAGGRGDQSLGIVAVAVQDRRTLFNAFIASSPDQLVGFAVEVGLKDLCDLRTAQSLERGKPIGGGIGKGNNVGVDLFHGVVSFGC